MSPRRPLRAPIDPGPLPPRLYSVTTPEPVLAGGPAFVLSFNGRGFMSPSGLTPYFNGTALVDSWLESDALLKATVPAELITEAGDFSCYVDTDLGATVSKIFTVLTSDGLPPVNLGDPCTVDGAIRKASDGTCVQCSGGVWIAADDSACNPSTAGDLTDIYIYGLETHEKFFDHFEIEMRDAPDGAVLQFKYADGHYTDALEVWTMNGFVLFEGVTQGQTYYFRSRVVTANGIPSQWSDYQAKVAEVVTA